MDPRRVELNRVHSIQMGLLFEQFLQTHPGVEPDVDEATLTPEQEAEWTAYSAQLLARQQAERSALADQIEAEQRRS
ncbi:hypothetical protein [Mycobacterium deserti]|uniref:Uncharacterized protein n=1 Tax=Mycobacterium deserti TaxID=2978347 RepID=A0ABT2ME64_9MYCO|nr:hypothetical protein [Mycobacterium deserti]MCT7659695.1 hypothetical protein [Mycobacterium deserti]